MTKIIKAGERHIPAICRLWWEFMIYSADVDPILAPIDGTVPIFEKEHLRPAMQNENNLVLVALDGKKVVGYSFSLIQDPGKLAKRKKYGCIHDLFVTADYRRRGIGEKMYDEILKWFHAKDIDRVELNVIPGNRAACSFWRKQEYEDFQYTLYRKI